MKSTLAWALALVMIAAAWSVTVLTPADDAGSDAFVTDVAAGERGSGRNIAATVGAVTIAKSVTAESGWNATGNWVVIEVTAEASSDQVHGLLSLATLKIGDRTYSASERGPDEMTLYRTQLVPGVPQTGSLLFEVPENALRGSGILRLATSTTPWGDSILQVNIDLDAADRVGSTQIADVDWAAG